MFLNTPIINMKQPAANDAKIKRPIVKGQDGPIEANGVRPFLQYFRNRQLSSPIFIYQVG